MRHTFNPTPYIGLLQEFQSAFDFPVYDNPDNAPFAVHDLRARLIKEEALEYQISTSPLEDLDGLMDTMYVLAGTAVTYSTPVVETSTHHDLVGSHPNLYSFMMPVLTDLYSKFPCQKQLIPSISAAMNRVGAISEHLGFRTWDAFVAVHENNMEKLWSDSITLSSDVVVTPKGKKYLVKDKGGKVIKPPAHTKVDLSPYL